MFDVNYIAVFAAAIANMVLGAIWYSPALFSGQWMELMGIDKKNEKQMAAMKEDAAMIYGFAFLGSVIMAYVLALVFNWLGVEDGQTGVIVVVILWLGFTAVPSFTHAMFEKKSKKLWAIDDGYTLAALAVMALVLAWVG